LPKLEQIKAGKILACLILSRCRDAGFSAREMLKYGMGSNMPSLFPMIRLWIIILACVFTYIHAQAGFGYEGGRAEDTIVRAADLLARHPVATILILVAGTVIAWVAARFSSSTKRQCQAAACIQTA
jgi:hypothetical protein